MRKIMILGAGVLQMPAIVKAKNMGLQVAVVDINRFAPGVAIADKFYQLSTNDIDGIVNAATEFLPDGVMTLATDMPMRSVAAVAEKLHLNAISMDVAEKATDKIKMIQCFAKYSVPHPWFEVVATTEEFIALLARKNFPFILKPNDSSGSRGVILVKNKADALESYQYSRSVSKEHLVLVEEYMQGPEVSVEIIRIQGNTKILAVTDKLTTGAPYFVEMGHSQPSQLPNAISQEIEKIAIRAIEAVGIDNSTAHVEIIVTKEGPKLVELGARMGGDCITTHLVPLSTGIDMVEASILLALGENKNIESSLNSCAAIRYINSKAGVLHGIEGVEAILKDKHIKHIEIVKKIGDEVGFIHGSGDRIGYVIAQHSSVKEAIKTCENALLKLKLNIK